MARFGRVYGAANSSRIERRKEKEESSTLVFPKVVSPLEDGKSVSLYDAGVACGFGVLDQTVHPGLVIGNTTVFLPFPSDLELLLQGIDCDGQLGDSSVFVLNNSQFKINNFKWNSSLMDLFNMFIRNYRWGRLDIDFGNSRLLILPEGSSFHHKPIKPTQNHLGSLMIGLPSLYKGGKVICYENDSEHPTFTHNTSELYEFDFFAYLSEMNLEIESITSGTKFYLVYPISSSFSKYPSVGGRNASIQTIENRLKSWNGDYKKIYLSEEDISNDVTSIQDGDYNLITALLESNKKLIETPHEVELWVLPKGGKYKYFCKCSITTNGELQGNMTQLSLPVETKYRHPTDSGSDGEEYVVFKQEDEYLTMIILKKSYVLDFMGMNCATASFLKYINSDSMYTIDTISRQIKQIESRYLHKIENQFWNSILPRFIVDTKAFITVLRSMYKDFSNLCSLLKQFGGVKYDESLKYNQIEYKEEMLQDTHVFSKVLCYESDPNWDTYSKIANNLMFDDIPTMVKLPNGVLVDCFLTKSKDNKFNEFIGYQITGVFYHPDYEIIKKSAHEMIKQNQISLKEFLTLLEDECLISYFDLSILISSINDFYISNWQVPSFISNIEKLFCEKYWTSLSEGIINIMENIAINNLLIIIMLNLYRSKDEFKQNIANKFLPIFIRKVGNLRGFKTTTYNEARYFFELCCLMNSFELAECAKNLGYLNLLSHELVNPLWKENEEWHKYFVKARLEELTEEYENLEDSKFYQSGSRTAIYIAKQKIEEQIDELKEKYPYLYLGKRPLKPAEINKESDENPPKKQQKPNLGLGRFFSPLNKK